MNIDTPDPSTSKCWAAERPGKFPLRFVPCPHFCCHRANPDTRVLLQNVVRHEYRLQEAHGRSPVLAQPVASGDIAGHVRIDADIALVAS